MHSHTNDLTTINPYGVFLGQGGGGVAINRGDGQGGQQGVGDSWRKEIRYLPLRKTNYFLWFQYWNFSKNFPSRCKKPAQDRKSEINRNPLLSLYFLAHSNTYIYSRLGKNTCKTSLKMYIRWKWNSRMENAVKCWWWSMAKITDPTLGGG